MSSARSFAVCSIVLFFVSCASATAPGPDAEVQLTTATYPRGSVEDYSCAGARYACMPLSARDEHAARYSQMEYARRGHTCMLSDLNGTLEFECGKLLVGLQPSASATWLASFLSRLSGVVLRMPRGEEEAMIVRVPAGAERSALLKVIYDPAIRYVEFNLTGPVAF